MVSSERSKRKHSSAAGHAGHSGGGARPPPVADPGPGRARPADDRARPDGYDIALPDAQRALDFSNVDRQWVITAYALTFGSLLLFGGRLGDLFGRKLTFITGLVGFWVASAVGGASVSFAMLVTARACQGVFGALLAPAALSILTTTFSDPEERGKAFAVFGAIVGAGGLIGLLLGGALTQYLDWRWCRYVNLVFAAVALAGALVLLPWQKGRGAARLDVPGVVSVPGERCSAWCTASPTRPPTAGARRPRWESWRQAWCCCVLRLLADAGPLSAAAAAGGPEPQPRRVLPDHPDRGRGHVRHLLVPHLLPADDAALLAPHHGGRVPADDRGAGGVRSSCRTRG